MSIARLRAVVISHAPGLSGIPCSGHFSSAATRLSWTTSSARSKSPRARTSAAVSRPASSRKTVATAASVAVRVSSAQVFVDGPHFDDAPIAPTRPRLGHGKRLIEIFDLDNSKPVDDLFGLDERPIGDDGFVVLDANRRPG